MISKNLFLILLSSLMALFACSSARAECVCMDPYSPCQAIGAQLVFLGTVTKIQSGHSILMKVDRAYKGALDGTVEVLNDIMCPGPLLKLGGQYLIYTSSTTTGRVEIHQCSRIRSVDEAAEDFKYLSQYVSGSFIPYVAGTVRSCKEKGIYQFCDDSGPPLKGIMVTLLGEGKSYQAITDEQGKYFFPAPPPGEYDIETSDPVYKSVSSPPSFKLVPKGCAEGSFLLEIERKVEGIVRNAYGEPVEGAHIEMSPIGDGPKGWDWPNPVLPDDTDKDGKYKIEHLPHGKFYLGVNLTKVPTKESPYPSTYYPNALDKVKAIAIAVPETASVQNLDIVIPYRLPVVEIEGRLVKKDGSPLSSKQKPAVLITDPHLSGGAFLDGPIKVDEEGRFAYELCEGGAYSIYALYQDGDAHFYSAPIQFTPTQKNHIIVLTLDKSLAEFEALRQQISEK
jgi:hypothetical protein